MRVRTQLLVIQVHRARQANEVFDALYYDRAEGSIFWARPSQAGDRRSFSNPPAGAIRGRPEGAELLSLPRA